MRNKWLYSSLFIIGLAMSPLTWGGKAWVSIPSTPDASNKVVIKGGNLAAFSAVTVRVIWPNGAPVDQIGSVAEDGTFTVECLPSMIGSYAVTVLDNHGNKISDGMFGYIH